MAFDVASLKPAHPTPPFPVTPGATRRGTTIFTNVTLAECIRFAFDLSSDDQIAGPDWIKSPDTLFDITAKAPPETTADRVRQMTANLLQDRFHIKLHHEQREIPFYALVIDRKGLKMKEASPDAKSGMQLARGKIIYPGASIATLIACFEHLATGRPIVDETGLKSKYDVNLTWAVRPPQDAANGLEPEDLTFFEAVPEQLGLRLEMRKGPMDILVVDSADRTPVEN